MYQYIIMILQLRYMFNNIVSLLLFKQRQITLALRTSKARSANPACIAGGV